MKTKLAVVSRSAGPFVKGDRVEIETRPAANRSYVGVLRVQRLGKGWTRLGPHAVVLINDLETRTGRKLRMKGSQPPGYWIEKRKSSNVNGTELGETAAKIYESCAQTCDEKGARNLADEFRGLAAAARRAGQPDTDPARR